MEKKTRMFNRGLSQHRFKDNPLERALAEQWDKINRPPGESGVRTIEHLLTVDGQTQYVEAPQRVFAATLIQWLGSPVGQGFLTDCGFTHESVARNPTPSSCTAREERSRTNER